MSRNRITRPANLNLTELTTAGIWRRQRSVRNEEWPIQHCDRGYESSSFWIVLFWVGRGLAIGRSPIPRDTPNV